MGSIGSSSSFGNDSIIKTLSRSGESLNIDFLSNEQLNDTIKEITRIRIPFFDNIHLQTISNVVYVTGNSPFHEGLIIKTINKRIFVTQTYPITFQNAFSYEDAVHRISSFCSMNRNTKNYEIKDIWIPKVGILIQHIINYIRRLPNKYDIINHNCQNYCNNILNHFPLVKSNYSPNLNGNMFNDDRI